MIVGGGSGSEQQAMKKNTTIMNIKNKFIQAIVVEILYVQLFSSSLIMDNHSSRCGDGLALYSEAYCGCT
jgi:hypothetical protein